MVGNVCRRRRPITIQSMTITKTTDHEATPADLRVGRSCCGCRALYGNEAEAEGAAASCRVLQYRSSTPSPVPACTQALPGPGSTASSQSATSSPSTSRPSLAGQGPGHSDPYRGNGGHRSCAVRQVRRQGHAEAMVESGCRIAYFEEVDDLIRSRRIRPAEIKAYRQLSEATDHPLHLGVTEASATGGTWPLPGLRPCSPKASRRIRYSPLPTRSRPRPAVNCSRPWACVSARTSTTIACPSCGSAEVDATPLPRARWPPSVSRIPPQVAVIVS